MLQKPLHFEAFLHFPIHFQNRVYKSSFLYSLLLMGHLYRLNESQRKQPMIEL